MKKTLAAAALGCALVGPFAVATPTSAQIPTNLKASISPTTVAPGGNVHITPDAPCPAGSTSAHWSLGPGAASGSAMVATTMGGWDINITAPSAAGQYPVFVSCKSADGNDSAQYVQLSFTVQAGAASARGGRPSHTG